MIDDKLATEGIIISDNIEEMIHFFENRDHKYMIVIMLNQSGRLQIESDGKPFILGADQVLLVQPDQLSGHYMYSPDFHAVLMLIDSPKIHELFNEMVFDEPDWWRKVFYLRKHPVLPMPTKAVQICNLIMSQMDDLPQQMAGRYLPRFRSYLLKIFVCGVFLIVEQEMQTEASALGQSPDVVLPSTQGMMSRADSLFKDFLSLLNAQRPRPRFVSWYAKQLCVCEKYLSSVCQRISGKTATRWINEAITEDIRHMLLHTNLSVKEIAFQLDFPNISFFGRYTKQHLGMGPVEFRHHNLQQV